MTLVNGDNSYGLIMATAAATVTLVVLLTRLANPPRPSVFPSPLQTIQRQLGEFQEKATSSLPPPSLPPSPLLYPPDYFPGARDVPTPYGSIRCYEFGPLHGRKVLLLHGISTSCMTLTFIAHGLVERLGCRVLLLDLFGRGYSDAPGDLPYDARLFVTQALCALTAAAAVSPGWMSGTGSGTGSGESEAACGFDVLGYSLGGGIAVHLATAFPALVRSVVLLAPAGLIREETFGWASRLVFRSGWVPEGILEVLTRWRLRKPIAASAKKRKDSPPTTKKEKTAPMPSLPPTSLPGEQMVEATVTSEIADPATTSTTTPTTTPPPPNELQRKVFAFVSWQTVNHPGFTTAFQSTVRHGPLMHQHEAFRKLAHRKPKTVLFLFGEGDQVVNEEDYREDALPLVGGPDHVVWRKSLRGGHDFPMVDPDTTLQIISEFWKEGS